MSRAPRSYKQHIPCHYIFMSLSLSPTDIIFLSFLPLRNVIMDPGVKTSFTSSSMYKIFRCLLMKLCKDPSKGWYITKNLTHWVYFCFLSILMLVNLIFLIFYWLKCWRLPLARNHDLMFYICLSKSFSYKLILLTIKAGLKNRVFDMVWMCICKVKILMAACRLNV